MDVNQRLHVSGRQPSLRTRRRLPSRHPDDRRFEARFRRLGLGESHDPDRNTGNRAQLLRAPATTSSDVVVGIFGRSDSEIDAADEKASTETSQEIGNPENSGPGFGLEASAAAGTRLRALRSLRQVGCPRSHAAETERRH